MMENHLGVGTVFALRWLLDRDDSPWYPTVRLFRQTIAGDYEGVVDRMRAELLTLIEADRLSRL
jgi:hypothetical protein